MYYVFAEDRGQHPHFPEQNKDSYQTAQITFELLDTFLPLGDCPLWKVKWPGR